MKTKAFKYIQELKYCVFLPWRILCRVCGIGYSTFMRWKQRYNMGKDLVDIPGPKKSGSIDLDALQTQINSLNHGAKRSRGSGCLYEKVKDCISRRIFQWYVTEGRKDYHKKHREALHHVEWLYGGIAWAIDDTMLG